MPIPKITKFIHFAPASIFLLAALVTFNLAPHQVQTQQRSTLDTDPRQLVLGARDIQRISNDLSNQSIEVAPSEIINSQIQALINPSPISTQNITLQPLRPGQPFVFNVPPLPRGGIDRPVVSLEVVTQPTNGELSVNAANAQITYSPIFGFSGTDSLQVQACYSPSFQNCINFNFPSISVQAGNTTLIVRDIAVPAGQAVNVDISGASGRTVASIDTVNAPSKGVLTRNTSAGQVTYTAAANESGQDLFVVNTCFFERPAECEATRVNVAIQPNTVPTPRPPVAQNDTLTVNAGQSGTVQILSNDSNPLNPGNTALASDFDGIIVLPTKGNATFNPSTGALSYTANANASGTDTITYRIRNANGIATASVNITINAATLPQLPIAGDDTASVIRGQSTTIAIFANDSDPLATGSTVGPAQLTSINSENFEGTLSYQPTSGVVVVTANSSFVGTTAFTYTIQNADGSDTATVTLTITAEATPIIRPPVATNDTASVQAGQSVSINFLANDVDELTGAISSNVFDSIVLQPTQGTARFDNTTGQIVYTANPTASGIDTIEYRITNADGSDTGIITITIAPNTPVNPTPTLPSFSIPLNQSSVTPQGGIDIASVQITGQPASGTASFDANNGILSYIPLANTSGDIVIQLSANSLINGSQPIAFNVVIPTNLTPEQRIAPQVQPISQGITTIAPTTVLISNNVVSLSQFRITDITLSPTQGTVVITEDGIGIIYTPNANILTPVIDIIEARVCNIFGCAIIPFSLNITVPPIISINAVDDAVITEFQTAVEISVLGNDSITNSSYNTSSLRIVTSPTRGVITVNAITGTILYTPNSNESGQDIFVYEICDTSATPLCDQAQVLITINPQAINPNPPADPATPIDPIDPVIPVDPTNPTVPEVPVVPNTPTTQPTTPTPTIQVNGGTPAVAGVSSNKRVELARTGGNSIILDVVLIGIMLASCMFFLNLYNEKTKKST